MARRKPDPPPRSTADTVIRVLAFAVSTLILISGIFVMFLTIFRPNVDTSDAARNMADIINTVVGALIGYLAGSGKMTPPPPEPPPVRRLPRDDDEGTAA